MVELRWVWLGLVKAQECGHNEGSNSGTYTDTREVALSTGEGWQRTPIQRMENGGERNTCKFNHSKGMHEGLSWCVCVCVGVFVPPTINHLTIEVAVFLLSGQ